MGLGAAGGILNIIGSVMANNAMNAAFKAEMARQAGFRNQASAELPGVYKTQGVEYAKEHMAKGKQNRLDAYNEVGQVPFSASQPKGSGATKTDNAAYSLSGLSRAKLASYGDWQLDKAIDEIRAQEKLRKISNFAAGDADVFPYKMQDAQHAGDDWKFIGSLLGATAPLAGGLMSAPQRPYAPYMGGNMGIFDMPTSNSEILG